MEDTKKRSDVFEILCPCCQSAIWIDPVNREVIQFERGQKKKGSLEELLIKEKEKKAGFERKFQATAELEKKRRKKVKEKFEKAFTEIDQEE
jgi:hypothetical protein